MFQQISYIKSIPSGWTHLVVTYFQLFHALQGGLFYPHSSPCVFSMPLCELVKASGHVAAMSWSIFTSSLMLSHSMYTHLVMPRTGSVSVPRSTQAGCASSMPVSATPAVTEPHASQSRHWRQYVSAPTGDKVYCVTNVSVTKSSSTH